MRCPKTTRVALELIGRHPELCRIDLQWFVPMRHGSPCQRGKWLGVVRSSPDIDDLTLCPVGIHG